MVNSDSIRSSFVQQVLEFVLKFKFDGVDIDWEYPSKKIQNSFILLIQAEILIF